MKRLLVLALVSVVMSCGGGGSKPTPGTTCLANSECHNPLSCTAGRCHEQCQETRDCPLGSHCVVNAAMEKVCQLPDEVKCALNSQCNPPPLICAKDLQCRNQCETDRDCNKNQTCIEHVCADTGEFNPATMTLNPPSGLDGGVVGTPDGSAGTDAPGSTTDGPATANDAPMVETGAPAGDASLPTTPIPVDAVTVDHPIVRQGELGIMVTVTAPSGLTGATNIEVGDCKGTLQAGATDTMFVVRVSCQHGVALGPKDLKFQTAKGVGTKAAVLAVSAITSAPTGMDTNRGTSDQPFRTFKKALSVADVGDTVQLMDGTYDKDGGEDFKDPIPSKITILGQSAAGTKLIGPSDAAISVDGIHLREAGDLTVKNLSLGYFRYGIAVDKAANLTLENVKVTHARNYGLYVNTAAADGSKIIWTGDDSEITDHVYQAVLVYSKGVTFSFKSKGTISSASANILQMQTDKSTLVLDGATVTSAVPAAQAITLPDGTNYEHTVTLNNATINGAITIGGKDKSTATITGTTITLPTTGGGTDLDFTGGKLTLSGSTLKGGYYNLQIHSGEVVIRRTTFQDYYSYGVHVRTAKKVDLGTETDPGVNAFVPNPANANSYAIYDSRPPDPTPITVSETTVKMNAILPRTYETVATNMQFDMPPLFHIVGAGNKIIVYQ